MDLGPVYSSRPPPIGPRIAAPIFPADKPVVLSDVAACRRFPVPRSPPATLVQTPSDFQVVCRFTEGHFRAAPQGSAEMSPLLRSGNPLRWIPGPFQKSPLRRRDPNPPPPSPQRTSAAIPTTGSVARRPLCQVRGPVPLPPRNPGRNAPASCPSRSKCGAVVYADCAALERLPIAVPRSSAAKGTRGHAP